MDAASNDSHLISSEYQLCYRKSTYSKANLLKNNSQVERKNRAKIFLFMKERTICSKGFKYNKIKYDFSCSKCQTFSFPI